MLTLAELRHKAERKYLAALGTAFLPLPADAPEEAPTPLFPLCIACGKLTEAEARRRWTDLVAQLEQHARPGGRPGYELRRAYVNTRTSQAWQTLPQEAVFGTPADLFAFLGKTRQAAGFRQDAELVLQRLPQLAGWLRARPQLLLDYAGQWESLVRVSEFFLALAAAPAAPRPYLRELRIEGVHTKFVEQHTRPLRLLLDELLPPGALGDGEKQFLRRYGLREAEPLVRLRLLDDALSAALPFQLDDLAVPVSKFRELALPCQTVLIVENLTTFLSLPPLPGTVAVWGKGFQVAVLAGTQWARSRQLLYWGDLDAAGLQILNQLRAHSPHAQALLMDAATLARHPEHHGQPAKPVKPQHLHHLSADEQALFDHLVTHHLRLEQEHLPLSELLTALQPHYPAESLI